AVTVLVTRDDRVEVDRRRDARLERVAGGDELAFELREPAPDLRHNQVPDGENHFGMDGIDVPGAGDVAGDGRGREGGHGGSSLGQMERGLGMDISDAASQLAPGTST